MYAGVYFSEALSPQGDQALHVIIPSVRLAPIPEARVSAETSQASPSSSIDQRTLPAAKALLSLALSRTIARKNTSKYSTIYCHTSTPYL